MRYKLFEIWYQMAEKGYAVRHDNLCGLTEWLKLHPTLSDFKYDLSAFSWNPCVNWSQIYGELRNMCETGETFDLNRNTHKWVRDHFLLQHPRIVLRNPEFSCLRLAQIGYNYGQMMSEHSRQRYEKPIIKHYFKNKLDMPETYFIIGS